MRNIFISGFLSGVNDLNLFADSKEKNVFVDLNLLLKETSSLPELKEKFLRLYGSGPYKKAICYSFGGRLISRLNLEIEKTFFISSNFLNLEENFKSRQEMSEKWLKKFRTDTIKAKVEWNQMPLFSSHSMASFRDEHCIQHEEWDLDAIESYFKNFFYLNQPAFYKDTDCYIYGSKDLKYKRVGEVLSDKLEVHRIDNTGHRCCFERPEALKNIIQSVV